MRKLLYEDDFPIGENKRIVLNLFKVEKDENFPTGFEFAVQYLYHIDGEWQQIARIDNQLHEGKPGTHIHKLKRGRVEWVDMDFHESKDKIIEIGENVIKNILRRYRKTSSQENQRFSAHRKSKGFSSVSEPPINRRPKKWLKFV